VTPEEKERIKKWNDGLSSDVLLRFITTDDKRSEGLSDFCGSLSALAPKVRVVKDEGDPKDLPALVVGPRLRYHAIPLGKELDPFLIALASDPTQLPQLTASEKTAIDNINMPAFLRLFVTRQCPFCPVTVRQLLPLPATSEHIHLAVIEGTLFPETAQQFGVQSAPTLLLDGQFRWTGSVPLSELLQMMSSRDPRDLGVESLESMLKEGNALLVAEMMLQKESIFPAFVDLLAHEKIFIRLGAMVVMETIADENTALAAQVIDPLWERFSQAPGQVQGDILHVLGESGGKSAIPKLETVLAGKFSDEVKEAAREVLEKINP